MLLTLMCAVDRLPLWSGLDSPAPQRPWSASSVIFIFFSILFSLVETVYLHRECSSLSVCAQQLRLALSLSHCLAQSQCLALSLCFLHLLVSRTLKNFRGCLTLRGLSEAIGRRGRQQPFAQDINTLRGKHSLWQEHKASRGKALGCAEPDLCEHMWEQCTVIKKMLTALDT